MGFYDEFLYEFTCPECGGELRWWQTKALDCGLERYEPGDPVHCEGLVLERAKVHVYEHCSNCKTWYDAYAVIEDGRFVRVEDIAAERLD